MIIGMNRQTRQPYTDRQQQQSIIYPHFSAGIEKGYSHISGLLGLCLSDW